VKLSAIAKVVSDQDRYLDLMVSFLHLRKANAVMSWNPQDPNSQYGGYSPQQPNPNPSDPYSGQQYGQSSQQGAPQYDPNAYQQGNYQQPQYDPNAYQQPGYGQQQQQQYSYQAPYGAQMGAAGIAASANAPTSMGMSANIAAGLSYVLGWITGIIFFFAEKQNRFVRFHAMQSILFFGGLTVIRIILSVIGAFDIPFLGLLVGLVSLAVGIIGLVGYIVLLINGFQGKFFKLPIVGDYAERYVDTGKFQ
jgi:uncharacterized membrane protein